MSSWIELGPGVHISEVVKHDSDEVAGWLIGHRDPESELPLDAGWCDGYVPKYPSQTNHRGWNTSTGSVATGDLTLRSDIHSFSIQCHSHSSFHGFVTDGKWVPA